MKMLTEIERARIVTSICEGNSIRATSRMTGFSKNTITKLLVELGDACISYQDKALRNLRCKRLQCDEIWSFVYAKDKNLPADKQGKFGFGSVWTWTAIDADTKLVPTFAVGERNAATARLFIEDLASRLASRVQLTSDGLKFYLTAVEGAFGADIDFAQLHKVYESNQEETRYSPATCVGCERKVVMGSPDPDHISTSYVERQNLSMRMHMRRFTRLTNAFSKKITNHVATVAVYFMWYNFVRIHQTLRCTPAMEAGVTTKLWTVLDMIRLLPKPVSKPRGPYKKKNNSD